MTKAEIIEKLKGAGIAHDPSAKKAELEALLPEPEDQERDDPATVRVRALVHLVEGGDYRAPGEEFEVTPDRLRALGRKSVERI
jgi:hypothetical protein